jgi:putative transposase
LHVRVGNARRDYLRTCSTFISKKHAFVCIEDLRIKNMSFSASSHANVRAKSGLNKSILDQCCVEFCRQLKYKLMWNGDWFVAVLP